MLRKKIKWFLFLFPILFIFELFFGYSGKMIMLGNVSIRQFLFAGTFFSLYFYCFCLMFSEFKRNKKSGLNFKNSLHIVLPKICILDISFFLVFVSTVFFSTVVPLFSGTGVVLAKKEVLSFLLMTLLSFPIFFLIKKNKISFKFLDKYIYYLVFFLSILHVVLFIGQDINSHFIYNYFFFLNTILGKTSIFPEVMLGHFGVPRVFFTTSIFLPIGIYFSLKKLGNFKLFDHIYLVINILAIVSTMTKSLWLGVLIGLFVYFIFIFFVQKEEKHTRNKKNFLLFLAEILSFVVISNYTIFNDRVFHHFSNSFVYDVRTSEGEDENFKNKIKEKFKSNTAAYYDREGSIISNNIKLKQIQLLLKKWKNRPMFGYGYGSYLDDFIRSEEAPFSYEMVFFSLLMKIGILGVLFWIFLLFSLFYTKNKYKKNKKDYFCWSFLVVSFFVMVQTNPLLFNAIGIAFLLFISMDAIKSLAELKNKNRKKFRCIKDTSHKSNCERLSDV